MKMPLKDFYTLLRIRNEEERKKQEYLRQQQQQQTVQLSARQSRMKF